jgi:hypothetical protein
VSMQGQDRWGLTGDGKEFGHCLSIMGSISDGKVTRADGWF